MYEHRTQAILPRGKFVIRMIWHSILALAVIGWGLFIGVWGYHLTEGLTWIDSLLNASMLLGGEGPVAVLHTNAGKLFASFYAVFSGVIFLVTAAVLVAPVAHRFLHWLHLDTEGENS